jgi:hypothetical protein
MVTALAFDLHMSERLADKQITRQNPVRPLIPFKCTRCKYGTELIRFAHAPIERIRAHSNTRSPPHRTVIGLDSKLDDLCHLSNARGCAFYTTYLHVWVKLQVSGHNAPLMPLRCCEHHVVHAVLDLYNA